MSSKLGPALAITIAAALCSPGCAPSALSSIRHKMAAGQYAEARGELLVLAANEDRLNARERREAKDDLCLADFMIGPPTYPLSEQRRVCADAAKEPESQSAQIAAKLNDEARKSVVETLEAALEKHDLVAAEQGAVAYQEIPGADPALMDTWSRKMWAIINTQATRAERSKSSRPAIAAVRDQHPAMKSMNEERFLHWVAKEGTVDGRRMLSSVALSGHRLEIFVRDADLEFAALNLDRFATINDALVARCGCDGRTDVGIAETRFPLYLVRLDPQTRRSEVLILPHR